MKKIKSIILGAILIALSITLTSCSGSNISPINKILNVTYGVEANDIADYSTISDDTVGIIVSQIGLSSTVEITTTITFKYTYNVFGPWSRETRTVEDQEVSQATAFFINDDGYMITNAHCVTLSNSSQYNNLEIVSTEIKFNYALSNTTFDATVVTYDENLDLAIIKADTTSLTDIKYLTFYNITDPSTDAYNEEDAVKLLFGETAIAIGNANGYGISVTKGIISAPIRYFQDGNITTLAVQTDAPINSGNSGGPLLNQFGSVIGVNSFKIVTTTSESLGYAIPSNTILDFIDDYNQDSANKITYYYTNERIYSPSTALSNN